MAIREITIPSGSYEPGENLQTTAGSFTHVTISYDVSGSRYKVDRRIDEVIKSNIDLKKISLVDTTLYWQCYLDDSSIYSSETDFHGHIKQKLRKQLNELFIDPNDRSGETVKAYCMVGNIRAFVFEIDV